MSSEFPEAINFTRKLPKISENIYHHLGIYCYQLRHSKILFHYNQSKMKSKIS